VGDALVAIEERVIERERESQRRRLGVERWVQVRASKVARG
jgi:hypothetical protein